MCKSTPAAAVVKNSILVVEMIIFWYNFGSKEKKSIQKINKNKIERFYENDINKH